MMTKRGRACLAAGLCVTGRLPSCAGFSARPPTAPAVFGTGVPHTVTRTAVRSRSTRIGSTVDMEQLSSVAESPWANPEFIPRRLDPETTLLETADTAGAAASGGVLDVAPPVAEPRRKKRKGKDPELLEGDFLVNTPKMIALVYSSLGLNALYLIQALSTVASPLQALTTAAAAFVGYMIADVVSGVLHWSVDNYGNGKTPVFGTVIEAFQGHHVSPWTITHRPFENNVHKIAYAVLPLLALLRLVNPGPEGVALGVTFLVGSLMSNEFHRFAHMTDPPALVSALQKWGVLLNRKEHGLHHSDPFERKYCIVSGVCNAPLDHFQVFRRMEKIIYQLNGVEPICWRLEPSLKPEALALSLLPFAGPVEENATSSDASSS